MKSLRKEIRVILFFVGEMYKTSKAFVLLSLLRAVLQSFQPLINVIMPRFFLNEMTGLNRTGYLIIYAGIMIMGNFLIFASVSVLNRYISVGNIRMENKFLAVSGNKLMNIPFEKAEDPAFIELKERAIFPVTGRGCIQDLVDLLPRFVVQIIILAGTLSIIATFDSIIIFVILFTVLINIVVAAAFQKQYINSQKQTVNSNKQYGYYLRSIDNVNFEMEARIYGSKEFTMGKTAGAYKFIMDNNRTSYSLAQLPLLIKLLIGVAQNFTAYLYIGWKTLEYNLPLGDFSLYISAAAVFGAGLFELLSIILKLRETCRYLDDFTNLLRLEEQTDGGTLTVRGAGVIQFDNVGFKYTGSDKWVLRNFNLRIAPGESLSVVGKNGAGKSTLVKLLTRLYNPVEGRILLDGIDVREYKFDSYRRFMSVIFQDFSIMNYSVAENVYCDGVEDEALARQAMQRAGISEYIDSLPKGIHTPVGKWYDEDGTDFSGGQLQKIALARSLYRNAPLIILDEPTASLDPLGEAEVYENFNAIKEGKTAVYISHRLSSCKFADRIIYIDNGIIAEEGTHGALIKLNGCYAEMFNIQASALQKSLNQKIG